MGKTLVVGDLHCKMSLVLPRVTDTALSHCCDSIVLSGDLCDDWGVDGPMIGIFLPVQRNSLCPFLRALCTASRVSLEGFAMDATRVPSISRNISFLSMLPSWFSFPAMNR